MAANDETRVHMATESLVRSFRVIRPGEPYLPDDETRCGPFPAGYQHGPACLKVRVRQPHCLKLGTAVPVLNDEIGHLAAQRFANMLGLRIEAAVAGTGTDGPPPWMAFEPEQHE